MKTRLLGTTGIEVSEIGLGAWQLGSPGWGGPSEEVSLGIIEAALDLGVNFLDTAPIYGDGRSEDFLGKALEGRRDDAVVCTKFGHRADGTTNFDVDEIEGSLEESLRRLRTDHVDIVLLHNPPLELMDGKSPHYAELGRLRDAGLIRAYGVSLDWRAELELVLTTTDCQVVEVVFNAFHQEPQPAMRRAAEQGVGVIVKVPLDSGWLSGKYGADASFAGVRDRWSREEIERRSRLVEQFQLALPDGADTAESALSFVLAEESVSTVIPGAKSVAQLRANVAASDAPLATETLAAIRSLWEREIAGDPLPW